NVVRAVALSEDGRGIRYIATVLNVHRSTIQDVIQRYRQTDQAQEDYASQSSEKTAFWCYLHYTIVVYHEQFYLVKWKKFMVLSFSSNRSQKIAGIRNDVKKTCCLS
ncbi:HTH 29 domain containing protein, partial [Asbolus verrucosus]